jgi:hypothetical protein
MLRYLRMIFTMQCNVHLRTFYRWQSVMRFQTTKWFDINAVSALFVDELCATLVADTFCGALRQSNSLFFSRDFKMAASTSEFWTDPWPRSHDYCDERSKPQRVVAHQRADIRSSATWIWSVSPTQNTPTQNHDDSQNQCYHA